MIDTLFFVLQLVGVTVILSWAMTNDARGTRGRTTGPLAFKELDQDSAATAVGGRSKERHSLQSRSGSRFHRYRK